MTVDRSDIRSQEHEYAKIFFGTELLAITREIGHMEGKC